MRYDDFDIDLARKRGAPDPEGNVQRANAILPLIVEMRLDEARSRLDEITDSAIRGDLEQLIHFQETCTCIRA